MEDAMQWETLWTFRTWNFAVVLDWTEEDSPDLSWDDTGEVQEKIASGEWVNCLFRVRVFCNGMVIGTDYLGNSIHERPEDFRDHLGCGPKGYGSYFADMVREAVKEARRTLNELPQVRAA
jgi:hypothetical protein